jgi:hypothetical protein
MNAVIEDNYAAETLATQITVVITITLINDYKAKISFTFGRTCWLRDGFR